MTITSNRLHQHKRKLMLTVSLIVAFLIASEAVAQEQRIGYVLNLKGEWVLNSSQQLKAGDPVRTGDVIQLKKRIGGEFIEIVDNDGHRIDGVSGSCGDIRCDHPIKLRAPIHRNVIFRALDAVMEMFRDYPDLRKPVAISRGSELKEAVVKLENGQIDLSYVLANLSRGRYLLRFEPVKFNEPNKAFLDPVRVDWNPNKPAVVSVKGLSPGLYIAQPLSDADREPLEPGSESMILVTSAADYQKAAHDFNDAVKLTDSWRTSIRHESKRKFLRAVLVSLAAPARG